ALCQLCVPTASLMPGTSCFFFSSRRRHTRLQGDWSSDVCSSDLSATLAADANQLSGEISADLPRAVTGLVDPFVSTLFGRLGDRSEERRVGKECRWRWRTDE